MIAWKSRLKLSPSISGRLLACDERLQQRLVVRAGAAIPVAGQVRAFRQRRQPAEHAERGVVHDVVDVGASTPLIQLERQQREQRVDRGELTGAWVAGRGDQGGHVELKQLGHEQKQPCVLA